MSSDVQMMGKGTSLEGMTLQEYEESKQRCQAQYTMFGTASVLAFAGAGLLYLFTGMVMPLFIVTVGVLLVMGITNCFGF